MILATAGHFASVGKVLGHSAAAHSGSPLVGYLAVWTPWAAAGSSKSGPVVV